MHRVADHLFISNEASARNEALLQENGIHAVVSIGCPPAFPDRLQYQCYDIMDLPSTCVLNTCCDAAEFMDEFLRQQRNVLVHCVHGQSRSVTVVVAYLMVKRGMSLAEGIHTVAANHGDMCMNPGFQYQLHVMHELWVKQNPAAYAEAWLLGVSDLHVPFRSEVFPNVTKSVVGSYACSGCGTLIFHDFHRFNHATSVTEQLSMARSDTPGVTDNPGDGFDAKAEQKLESPEDADRIEQAYQAVTEISSAVQIHEYWASYRPEFAHLAKTTDPENAEWLFFAPPNWLLQKMNRARSSGEVRCGSCDCVLGEWRDGALPVCKGYAAVKRVAVRKSQLSYVPRAQQAR